MNEIIKHLKNHRSIREYDPNKDVNEEQVRAIIESAMAAPNWNNGQQVSIIEVREPEKKATMAKASGEQKWIEEAPVFLIFCMDFYRAHLAAQKKGKELRVVTDINSIIIGSTDVGIALSSAVIAAESIGLGTVPIGGIRRNPQTFIDLLQLPEYVFPITGLVVGYPREVAEQKPRLALKATYHQEQYNRDVQKNVIDKYDQTISAYMEERTKGESSEDWSSKVSTYYDKRMENYIKNVEPILRKQGFKYK